MKNGSASVKAIIKKLALCGLLFYAHLSYSQIDSYSWCQKHMDTIRSLSTMEMNLLQEGRRQISFSNSIESLSKATGKNYAELVDILISKEGKTREASEKYIMENIKPAEIYIINTAIEMHGITEEKAWSEWYKKCVSQSS